MKENIFMKIKKREVPAFIVYEDKDSLAFLDNKPVCEGHTLVIPKKQYQDIFDIPESELNSLMRAVKKVANILKKRLGANGINILHASGEAAQQSVPYFHFHLIPRRKNDGLDMWPRVNYKKIDLNKVYKKISD